MPVFYCLSHFLSITHVIFMLSIETWASCLKDITTLILQNFYVYLECGKIGFTHWLVGMLLSTGTETVFWMPIWWISSCNKDEDEIIYIYALCIIKLYLTGDIHIDWANRARRNAVVHVDGCYRVYNHFCPVTLTDFGQILI